MYKKTILKLMAAIAVTMGMAAPMNVAAETPDPDLLSRSLVFNLGDNGSKFYRIPAVVTCEDGTLVAVADKRIENNGDLPGKIDVVCRTSTDNGLSWTPAVNVAVHDENGGYGDPALVIDQKTGDILCIATHGQGLWTATPGDHARIVVMRSKDQGKTWSEPLDITDGFFTSTDDQKAPIKGVTGFASSGRALQLKDGRLMFVLVVRDNPAKGWSPLKNYAIYSDDGGYTWTSSGVVAEADGDEAKVTELSDGRILMTIRNRKRGPRLITYSSDRGETWTPAVPAEDLKDPACNGDLLTWDRNGREILLQSICNDTTRRANITIFASFDGGKTWPVSKTVLPGPGAYSALTILNDGSVGCFVEEQVKEGGLPLWFYRLDLSDMLDNYGK